MARKETPPGLTGGLSAFHECYDPQTKKCSPLETYIYEDYLITQKDLEGNSVEIRNPDPHEEEVNQTKDCDESIRCGQTGNLLFL